ncbi:MAG: aminotransferase [Beijerinckiaceae bacterium]
MTAAPLNPHAIDTGTPPIPAAKAWVQSYDGAFGPLIDLSQAAPAVAPPPAFLERLADAARDPASAKYGVIQGDAALREMVARDVNRLYAGDITADDIAITPGCNQAFVVTVMALAKAGDEIILPAPWYFNHKMALDLLGLDTRVLPCMPENGFVPDVAQARALVTDKTRAIVLVTPNNPTGAIYPPATIAAFATLCAEKNIWLVIDETYRDFLPHGSAAPHRLFAQTGWRNSVIQLYSFSKSYAIPGHRLGSVIAGSAVQTHLHKILDTIQICPARVGQIGVTWAIDALRGWREDNRADINARAAAFRQAMSGVNGWTIDSVGAYFAYLRHPFAGVSASAVAEKLAKERGILALPGSYFGPDQDTHLRVAFANADAGNIAGIPTRLRGLSL